METTYNQQATIQHFNKLIEQFTPQKNFQSEKFLGKLKWKEDALEYQKRIRNEWD